MQFEWSTEKEDANLKKHGVSFEEATTVFGDPLAKILNDDLHSLNEKREIIVGHSANDRLLIVCFTERDFDTLRLISARSATLKERKDYERSVR
jgi:uncharacterized DUF497 family protein